MAKTVNARVYVVVDSNGAYACVGQNGHDEKESFEFAATGVAPLTEKGVTHRRFVVSAELEVPEPNDVIYLPGTVKEPAIEEIAPDE